MHVEILFEDKMVFVRGNAKPMGGTCSADLGSTPKLRPRLPGVPAFLDEDQKVRRSEAIYEVGEVRQTSLWISEQGPPQDWLCGCFARCQSARAARE